MELKKLPLDQKHRDLGAKTVDFAGWDMPVQYGGIIDETLHTRKLCSVFDISHMGEFMIRDHPERCSLDRVVTQPVTVMPVGKCKYGFILNERGTVIDDLIVYRLKTDQWMLVVNAARMDADRQALLKHLGTDVQFEDVSDRTVKLDVQGPASIQVMTDILGSGINDIKFFNWAKSAYEGEEILVSRTGYTGEAGFEVYLSPERAPEMWDRLLAHPAMKPAGLGARNILRIEAGLPLYGSELTGDTTPLEAGMERFLSWDKEFVGREALLSAKESGVSRRLVGFLTDGRKSPHDHQSITVGRREAGEVTSGTYSPHLQVSIGMGYVGTEYALPDTEIEVQSGSKTISAKIVTMPFIKPGSYK